MHFHTHHADRTPYLAGLWRWIRGVGDPGTWGQCAKAQWDWKWLRFMVMGLMGLGFSARGTHLKHPKPLPVVRDHREPQDWEPISFHGFPWFLWSQQHITFGYPRDFETNRSTACDYSHSVVPVSGHGTKVWAVAVDWETAHKVQQPSVVLAPKRGHSCWQEVV